MERIILSPDKKPATLKQQLEQVHAGRKVIDLDLERYKPATLESVVSKPFEKAAENKESALLLTEKMERAVKLACESYNNPTDVEAAIATTQPPKTETPDEPDTELEERLLSDLVPTLPSNLARLFRRETKPDDAAPPDQEPPKDRLPEAVTLWRETTAKRREALSILQKGSTGVSTAAEFALAQRTSVQAGLSAEYHQRIFLERFKRAQETMKTATESLVGNRVDTKQKETSLEQVKQLRNQMVGEYLNITTYLEEQAEDEGVLWIGRNEELKAIVALRERAQELAQRVTELKHTAPTMLVDASQSSEPDIDSDEPAILSMLSAGDDQTPEDEARAEQAMIEKTRLVSEAEDNLTDCNNELAAHQKALMGIEAELDGIRERTRPHVEREQEMRQTICEELVVPALLATTPEIEATIQAFRDMKLHDKEEFAQLPKLIKEYAMAELWLYDELAPRVVRQVKKVEPERYVMFTMPDGQDEGPVATTDIRQFMKSVGIIILNRKDSFSDRIVKASEEYSTSVAQAALDIGTANLQDGIAMMNAASSVAIEGAGLRQQIVETGNELGTNVIEAIRELDDNANEVEKAVGEVDLALDSIGRALSDGKGYAQELREALTGYKDAREMTRASLAEGEEYTTEQQLRDKARREKIRKVAGLVPVDEGEEVELPTKEDYSEASILATKAQSADARAEQQAERTQTRHEEVWGRYEKLNTNGDLTAERIAAFYNARKRLFEALEHAATSGENVVVKTYDEVEKLIDDHAGLPVPRAIGEADVHKRFLALNGPEIHPATPTGRLKARGRAALAWLGF